MGRIMANARAKSRGQPIREHGKMPARGFFEGTGMRVVIVGCCLMLAGCGIAARVESRNEYQESAARYKECLAANPSTPKNCEGLRLAMETDERKYNNLSAGLNPGSQSTANVTVLNR
jgi:hypothetical protein